MRAMMFLSRALAVGLSWERIASDYDVPHGGLLPFGLIVLTLWPLIAAKLRGFKNNMIIR